MNNLQQMLNEVRRLKDAEHQELNKALHLLCEGIAHHLAEGHCVVLHSPQYVKGQIVIGTIGVRSNLGVYYAPVRKSPHTMRWVSLVAAELVEVVKDCFDEDYMRLVNVEKAVEHDPYNTQYLGIEEGVFGKCVRFAHGNSEFKLDHESLTLRIKNLSNSKLSCEVERRALATLNIELNKPSNQHFFCTGDGNKVQALCQELARLGIESIPDSPLVEIRPTTFRQVYQSRTEAFRQGVVLHEFGPKYEYGDSHD